MPRLAEFVAAISTLRAAAAAFVRATSTLSAAAWAFLSATSTDLRLVAACFSLTSTARALIAASLLAFRRAMRGVTIKAASEAISAAIELSAVHFEDLSGFSTASFCAVVEGSEPLAPLSRAWSCVCTRPVCAAAGRPASATGDDGAAAGCSWAMVGSAPTTESAIPAEMIRQRRRNDTVRIDTGNPHRLGDFRMGPSK